MTTRHPTALGGRIHYSGEAPENEQDRAIYAMNSVYEGMQHVSTLSASDEQRSWMKALTEVHRGLQKFVRHLEQNVE